MRRSIVLGVAAFLGAALLPLFSASEASSSTPGAEIRLLAATFTPARGEKPGIPPGLTIAGYAAGQQGYYIVQFGGPVRDEWKAAVEQQGAELLDYLPDNAFKVRMTPAEAGAVEALPEVTWVGLFHPAYKISPRALGAGPGLVRIRIEDGADLPGALAGIAGTGATPVRGEGRHLVAFVTGGQAETIARVLDVAWVEPFDFPVTHNEESGGIVLGGSAAIGRGYDGSTQTVAVLDTGLGDGTAAGAHPDIPAGRIVAIHNWSAADSGGCYDVQPDGARDVDSGHGTHTAVSAVGDGGTGGIGRGTAPAAGLVFQAVEEYLHFVVLCSGLYEDGYYLVGISSDLRDGYQQAYDSGARIHSNSWGTSGTAGDYTTDSKNSDDFTFTNPGFLITFSAGNDGADGDSDGVIDSGSLGSPGTAKNLLTVGASESDRTDNYPCDTGLSGCTGFNSTGPFDYPAPPLSTDPSAGNAEQMAPFSSRGPVDDGRIKPDVVAPGTWVLSGYSSLYQEGYGDPVNPVNGLYQYDGWGLPYSETYKYMGGTSMSNPLTAGAAAVVFDFYSKADTHPASAALVKATLINSARDLLDENNDGVDDNFYPIPNVHEGWGIVDLDAATDGSHQYVDQVVGLSTSEAATRQYEVETSGAPLRVTLGWSDYPSSESASVNLVNDLDLEVTAPDGTTTYFGNDFNGGWSQPGTTPDAVNNVENVFVSSAAAGTWTVTVHGSNVPMGPQPFALVVDGILGTPEPDTTAPVISGMPGNQTVEATGPSGASHTWTSPTATDDVDGAVPVDCLPSSGSTFPLGTTTVTCTATDSSGNSASDTFDVTVQDTTPPSFSGVPDDITAEATGPSGAVVDYTPPTASDLVDGAVAVGCLPASGSTFPLGTTTVTCSATDTTGNIGTATFDVTVQDTTPPSFSGVPEDQTLEATGPDGATATYTDPTASDIVDGSVPIECLPASGSTFALGTTTVTCSATDTAGNTGAAEFDITVQDTTLPVISGMPSDATLEATGPDGATHSWTSPTASDIVDGSIPVTCDPASGSTFPIGTTIVTCTATDSSGNTASETFDVTVQDTTAPVISGADDTTVEATGPTGAVVTFDPTASDLVDGSVAVGCSPQSGSTFALGATTVTCTATDGASNQSSADFGVTVQDTTPPTLSGVPGDQTLEATGPSGAVVDFIPPTGSDLVDGSVAVSCSPSPGSTFSLGTTTVTCSATDSSGNPGADTLDVTVQDTTPPLMSNVPADIVADAAGPSGAIVDYALPAAVDLVDGTVAVDCAPASGSTFPPGLTKVLCSAVDTASNEAADGFDVAVGDPPGLTRYAGSNRYATAQAISQGDFPTPDGVDTVFVAFGGDFPDGLAGAAVAARLGAPLLLVQGGSIPGATATELTRLAPDTIVILGGTAVISPETEAALKAYAGTVIRVAGPNRYATAVAISQYGFPDPAGARTVIVATGLGFADALASGPAAAALGGPVLLTHPDFLPGVVATEIARLGPDRIIVVGGTAVVSETVFGQLQGLAPQVERIAGPNRYSTAVAISAESFPSARRVYVATGLGFADALTGAASAGWWGGPVLLVPGDAIPGVVADEITRLGATKALVLGGTAVVAVDVEEGLVALVAV